MNIRAFREKHHLSVEDLASKVGVTAMTIYRWETGRVRKPNKVIKEKLERVMRGYKA